MTWFKTTAAEAARVGMDLTYLSNKLRERLRIPAGVRGVAVEGVSAGSVAAALGIRPGDVIETINLQPVLSPRQAVAMFREGAGGKRILILISRDGASLFLGLAIAGASASVKWGGL